MSEKKRMVRKSQPVDCERMVATQNVMSYARIRKAIEGENEMERD